MADESAHAYGLVVYVHTGDTYISAYPAYIYIHIYRSTYCTPRYIPAPRQPTQDSMNTSSPASRSMSDEGNNSHSLPSPGVDEGVSYTSGSGSGSGVGAAIAAPKWNANTSTDASGWKKRVSTACLACKKSKRKVGLA